MQQIRFLPKTGEPFLLAVILLLVAGGLTLGAAYLRDLLAEPNWFSFLAMVFCFGLATGLWLLHSVARWVAIATLCVITIVTPLAIINPFTEGDIAAETGQSPSKFVLTLWALSVIVPALLALYVLLKHKTQFHS